MGIAFFGASWAELEKTAKEGLYDLTGRAPIHEGSSFTPSTALKSHGLGAGWG